MIAPDKCGSGMDSFYNRAIAGRTGAGSAKTGG
jgi:hypothetical protein